MPDDGVVPPQQRGPITMTEALDAMTREYRDLDKQIAAKAAEAKELRKRKAKLRSAIIGLGGTVR